MTHSGNAKGFTVVELMVTVGIFALITSVLLVRNSKFDDETLLQAAAYEVALSVRQAQNYGINVQGQSGSFDRPYGIYFETGTTSYVLFNDLPEGNEGGNGYYDTGEKLNTFALGRGFTVQRICSFSSITPSCLGTNEESAVSIVFKRPEPEAIIQTKDGGTPAGIGVEVTSPRGGRRFVVVRKTGQIAVMKELDDSSQE